jgi:hypothetical protein
MTGRCCLLQGGLGQSENPSVRLGSLRNGFAVEHPGKPVPWEGCATHTPLDRKPAAKAAGFRL